jgi:hypothetical protein
MPSNTLDARLGTHPRTPAAINIAPVRMAYTPKVSAMASKVTVGQAMAMTPNARLRTPRTTRLAITVLLGGPACSGIASTKVTPSIMWPPTQPVVVIT